MSSLTEQCRSFAELNAQVRLQAETAAKLDTPLAILDRAFKGEL